MPRKSREPKPRPKKQFVILAEDTKGKRFRGRSRGRILVKVRSVHTDQQSESSA